MNKIIDDIIADPHEHKVSMPPATERDLYKTKRPSRQKAAKLKSKILGIDGLLKNGQWGLKLSNGKTIMDKLDDGVSLFTYRGDLGSKSNEQFQLTFLFVEGFLAIESLQRQVEGNSRCVDFISLMSALKNTRNESSGGGDDESEDDNEEPIEYLAVDGAIRIIDGYSEDDFAAILFINLITSAGECSKPLVLSACTMEFAQTYEEGLFEFIDNHPVKTPHIKFVGNLEVHSMTAQNRKRASNLYISESKLKQSKKMLPAGSCTLLMSLVFDQFLSRGYYMFNLTNAGSIAGCKCYVTAANAMGLDSYFVSDPKSKGIRRSLETTFRQFLSTPGKLPLVKIDETSCDRPFIADLEINEELVFISPALMQHLLWIRNHNLRGLAAVKSMESSDDPKYPLKRPDSAMPKSTRRKKL